MALEYKPFCVRLDVNLAEQLNEAAERLEANQSDVLSLALRVLFAALESDKILESCKKSMPRNRKKQKFSDKLGGES